MFLLKTSVKIALRAWRRAPISQSLSAMAVGFLLFLVGFLMWLHYALGPVLTRLKTEQVITAYVSPEVSEREADQLIDSIKTSLGSSVLENAKIEFTNSEGFLEKARESYPELISQLVELGNEIQFLIPKYISISGVLPQSTVEEVRKLKGIESVESSSHRFRYMITALSTLQRVTQVLMIGLCFSLLVGLIQLLRMNTQLQSDAISILRLWGAGGMILRIPGILANFFVGLAGGFTAFLTWKLFGSHLGSQIQSLSPLFKEMPLGMDRIGTILLILGAMAGVLSGCFGAIWGRSYRNL